MSGKTKIVKRRKERQSPRAPGELRELTIDSVGARGDGVAAGPVFVPQTLPGEVVRAEVSGERGVLREVLRPHAERIAPACRHFEICGGCALQHWDRGAYLAWKRDIVAMAAKRADVSARIAPVTEASASGRRRATFHGVRAASLGFVFGFSQRSSDRVFALSECPVLSPALDGARSNLERLADLLLPKSGRVDIDVTETDAGLDVNARGGASPDDVTMRSALAALAAEAGWARLSHGGEPVVTLRPPQIDIAGVLVQPPPAAFLQATRDGERVLGDFVSENVAGARLTVDLYAGLGTFAFRIARHGAVHAVEGAGPAVEALKRAAAHARAIKPVSVERRDLAREPMSARELRRFDAAVMDPPRAGAAAQTAQIAASGIRKLVYVSCNPATFARDARMLLDAGFSCAEIRPVDQFLWSPHVELMGAFIR